MGPSDLVLGSHAMVNRFQMCQYDTVWRSIRK